jgi:DNA polymerase-3 subunit delta'
VLADVQGQEEGVFFLRQVAERRYTSPLLLIGDEGVGRRYAVQQLARELFCTGTRVRGCECFNCTQLDEGTHPDFVTVSPEEDKEILIGQIRELISQTGTFPSIAPLKLFLVDGADRMNSAAANALLKTLEEPPAPARFFLTAEKPSRVIPTIQSRCGRVRFRALPETFVQSTLSALESDSNKALVYARMGEGSVGRAILYWGSGRIGLRDKVFSLIAAGVQGDLPSIFSIVMSIEKELALALRFLEQILHDLLIVRHEPARMINIDLADSIQKMSGKMTRASWSKLTEGTRTLNGRRSLKINLPFHVQTLFVEAFFGGV